MFQSFVVLEQHRLQTNWTNMLDEPYSDLTSTFLFSTAQLSSQGSETTQRLVRRQPFRFDYLDFRIKFGRVLDRLKMTRNILCNLLMKSVIVRAKSVIRS